MKGKITRRNNQQKKTATAAAMSVALNNVDLKMNSLNLSNSVVVKKQQPNSTTSCKCSLEHEKLMDENIL